MTNVPTVAIIGRPNTGKSTLFNRLIGRRQAIVSDIPGTTRDHVAGVIEEAEIPYLLVDTGGMGGGTEDKAMEDNVHAQSLLAIEHADLILFTVNSREELTASDFAIVDILRKRRRKHVPVLLIITKCDNPEQMEEMLPNFHQLGIADEVLPVSAPHRIGTDELETAIQERLKNAQFQKKDERQGTALASAVPRIAIIGQPNVGKSSLINAFMSDSERDKSPKLVSDVPGTTRDSTDTVIVREGKEFIFVDTAGLRKAAMKAEEIEGLSILRTVQALEHCDISILIVDATKTVSKQDKRIAKMAMEAGKGFIILLNKIDLLTTEQKKEKLNEMKIALHFCEFAPVVLCSAQTREGIVKIFDLIEMVQRNRLRRIATKDLQQWFSGVAASGPVGELGKSKYITQADELPPTFVVFVKDPRKVQLSQLKFLDRKLRETFGFDGTPIRWITKSSLKDER